MAGNPRIVTADATFMWDHAPQRLGRGTIIDVPPGGALERAIGADKLKPLFGAPPVTVPLVSEPAPEPAPVPVQEKAPAPRNPARAAAAAKSGQDPPDAGGGERM